MFDQKIVGINIGGNKQRCLLKLNPSIEIDLG